MKRGKTVKDATSLGKMLGEISWKDMIRTDKETIRAGQNLKCYFILWLILKYKSITKINSNFMVFIQEPI